MEDYVVRSIHRTPEGAKWVTWQHRTRRDYRSLVGFSPGGSTWVAYRPEDVEKMSSRLTKMWAWWRQSLTRDGAS